MNFSLDKNFSSVSGELTNGIWKIIIPANPGILKLGSTNLDAGPLYLNQLSFDSLSIFNGCWYITGSLPRFPDQAGTPQ